MSKGIFVTSQVVLKSGREKAIQNFHPWIFSGAVDRVDSELKRGNLARVHSSDQKFLGVGYFNPDSQITVRMLTFQDEDINETFFIKRFEEVKRNRESLISPDTNAYRLVQSEGDFLPGLIVDRYGDFLVVQFQTAGMDTLKADVVSALESVFHPKGIFEKDDSDARKNEGLLVQDQTLKGEEPPDALEIQEHGKKFIVNLKRGQKTGFFLDQRENRKWVCEHSKGKRVLDCFAYSGAFSVNAAVGGARRVTTVESQKHAMSLAKKNMEVNGLSGEAYSLVTEDVFQFLRKNDQTYDLIILDPPAFCKSKKQVKQAARGYKDINLQALKRLEKGGMVLTSSCSYFIDADLFQKIVFGAAKDSGRRVQIIQKISHAFDHPINIYHPEGVYLKGLILRVE